MLLHVGPADATEARAWIQDAVAAGRYIVHPHLTRRCAERRISLWEIKQAIRDTGSCLPYSERTPTAGGTNWRLTGRTRDGEELTIGVEAFLDHLGRRALLITVF